MAHSNAGEVTVPLDPRNPVEIGGVGVRLPRQIAAAGKVAGDGTIAFGSLESATSAAVQVVGDGARLQTITATADADRRFAYSFDVGLRPVPQDDGSVELLRDGVGVSVVVATISAPWSVDAVGRPVATS